MTERTTPTRTHRVAESRTIRESARDASLRARAPGAESAGARAAPADRCAADQRRRVGRVTGAIHRAAARVAAAGALASWCLLSASAARAQSPAEAELGGCGEDFAQVVASAIQLRDGGVPDVSRRATMADMRFGLPVVIQDFLMDLASFKRDPRLPDRARALSANDVRELRDSGSLAPAVCDIARFMYAHYLRSSDLPIPDAAPVSPGLAADPAASADAAGRQGPAASEPSAPASRPSAPAPAPVGPPPTQVAAATEASVPIASTSPSASRAPAAPTGADRRVADPSTPTATRDVPRAPEPPAVPARGAAPAASGAAASEPASAPGTPRSKPPIARRVPDSKPEGGRVEAAGAGSGVARGRTGESPVVSAPTPVREAPNSASERAGAQPDDAGAVARRDTERVALGGAEAPLADDARGRSSGSDSWERSGADARALTDEPLPPASTERLGADPSGVESPAAEPARGDAATPAVGPDTPAVDAAEVARTVRDLDTQLAVPPYLTRREMTLQGLRMPGDELFARRQAALDAREALRRIFESLDTQPALLRAVRTAYGRDGTRRVEDALRASFGDARAQDDGRRLIAIWRRP